MHEGLLREFPGSDRGRVAIEARDKQALFIGPFPSDHDPIPATGDARARAAGPGAPAPRAFRGAHCGTLSGFHAVRKHRLADSETGMHDLQPRAMLVDRSSIGPSGVCTS